MSEEEPTLKSSYLTLSKLYNDTEDSDDPSNSTKYQDRVAKALKMSNEMMKQINKLSLFSDNEELEEVTTSSLPFMNLSALLGYFLTKQLVNPADNKPVLRSRQLTVARSCFCDFLRLAVDYGVPGAKLPKEINCDKKSIVKVRSGNAAADLKASQAAREEKMREFRMKKELTEKLNILRTRVLDKETESHPVDDEMLRELYTLELQSWVKIATEEIDSIDKEMELVLRMEKLQAGGKLDDKTTEPVPVREPVVPLRPFILTKTAAQKAVFGLGYPSVPTYTLDQFYEAQVAAGLLPDGTANMNANNHGQEDPELQAIRDEVAEETDDPVARQKKIDWDDWVETHPKGHGNRHNRS